MVFPSNVDSPWARSLVRSPHQYAAKMIDRTGNSKSETFVAPERKRAPRRQDRAAHRGWDGAPRIDAALHAGASASRDRLGRLSRLLPNPGGRSARLVRLHRKTLQSSGASLCRPVYHPRTGGPPSRLSWCPPKWEEGQIWDYGLNPKMVSVPAPTPPLLAT
jgi:hypothetical protein